MPAQHKYQRLTPIPCYTYKNVTAAGTNQKVGITNRGTYVARVLVNSPGSSVALTIMDGTNPVASMTLSAGVPNIELGLALDNGLFYTLSGAANISFIYLDYVS